MKVQVLSRWQILNGFGSWIAIAIPASLFYWVWIGAALFFGLREITDETTARMIAIPGAVLLTLLGMTLYIRFFINRFARYRFELVDDSLYVHGMCGWRFQESYFVLSQIQTVTLGQPLNQAERILAACDRIGISTASGVLKDIKAGRLVIRDTNDIETVFDHADKAFELTSLLEALAELVGRGVNVQCAK